MAFDKQSFSKKGGTGKKKKNKSRLTYTTQRVNFWLEVVRAKLIESEKLLELNNFLSVFRFVAGIPNPGSERCK